MVRACTLTSVCLFFFFFSSRRRHTRLTCDWSSDVCSSDLHGAPPIENLRKLFRDYEGVFDVSSSDSYQYSFGGVFTPTLIDKVLLKNTPDKIGRASCRERV